MFHVTFTRLVPRIRKLGILTFCTTNWRKAGDGARYGDGSIYAFECLRDALHWAGRMDWHFHQESGSGKVSVVTFVPDGEWEEDHADPLSHLGSEGRWLKSRRPIDADQIMGASVFDLDAARTLVERVRP